MMVVVVSPWAALRFRRSKRANGWVLLGISQPRYGEVVQLLFEQQARLLKKFEQETFVSLLFESPEALAVLLALAFPAPPGCEPIIANAAGDRLLTEPLPKSLAQARWQLKAGEGVARVEQLSGRETFAQVVAIWANANAPRASGPLQVCLPPIQEAGRVAVAVGLDEEGFEEDEWEEDVVESFQEEAFEDVWEIEEPRSIAQPSVDQPYIQTPRSQLSFRQQSDFQDEVGAIAQANHPPLRRVQLPFEQPNAATDAHTSGANELVQSELAQTLMGPSRTNAGQRPLLPEESWAAAAAVLEGDQAVVWETPYPIGSSEPFEARGLSESCYEAQYPEVQHQHKGQELRRRSPAKSSAISTLARLAGRFSEGAAPPALMPSQTLSPVSNVPEDHGYVLSQGVTIWNEWRRANPHIRPTLRGAYLNNLNLAGADFHGVDLGFALLFRADLREANLSSAFLLGADLIRADLGGALLRRACLEGAYLSYANLAGADLTQANLQNVYWQGAILEGAILPNGQLFEAGYL